MGWVVAKTSPMLRTGYFYEDREIALHKKVGSKVKKPYHNTHWYPQEDKIEAATLWAVTRNIEKVHEITDIPRWAIKRWMKEPWWDNVVKQVRKEQNELLDAKLTEVISKAVDVIKDRVENGEVYVDRKTKEHYRVPVNVKSASIALEVTSRERHLIRGEATTRSETVDNDSKLQQLKDQFEKLAKSKLINTQPPLEGNYVSVSGTREEQKDERQNDQTEISSQNQECEGSWESEELLNAEENETNIEKSSGEEKSISFSF